jgi:hypothetical protein
LLNETKPNWEKNESYKHQFAKELLHAWISEGFKCNDEYNDCPITFIDEESHRILNVNWRSDFIWMEYPLTTDFPYLIDEMDCGLYSFNAKCSYRSKGQYCPCLKCKGFNWQKLRYVADIAIEHKGNIITLIEIVNKHPTEQDKKDFIINRNKWSNVHSFEIEADHIIGQIMKPEILFVRTI